MFEIHPQNSNRQSGNAMVYVLIVVALFAAINFILSKQNDSSEIEALTREQIAIYTTEIQQASLAVKQAIDQLLYSGIRIDELDFVTPDDEPDFSTGSNADNIRKVFHPLGGGLNVPQLADDAIRDPASSTPAPGWYLGRFNNVEWTEDDVLLVAHKIDEEICKSINKSITGSSNIPVISTSVPNYLIDDAIHGGTNIPFTETACSDCLGFNSLCVSNSAENEFSYYSVIATQ